MTASSLPPVPADAARPLQRASGASWRRLAPVLCPVAASLGTLAVVAWTVAPSVTFGDSGELLTAAATLGVPHPPGYPLYTMIAHLAIRAFPFASPAAAVNMLSAILLAVTGLLAYLAFREVAGAPEASLVAAWGFCLSPLVWDQATVTEVYTFDLALLALGLWMLLRLMRRAREGRGWTAAETLLLGLALGAAITHRATHAMYQATYLLALLFGAPRAQWLSARRVAWFAAGLLLAFSVWLYLPLRGGAWTSLGWAMAQPSYAWGPVSSWSEFTQYVSARQYSHYMWAAGPRLWDTALAFDLRALAGELSPLLWLAAALGAVSGWRGARDRCIPLFGVTAVTWVLFWNYVVIDPEVFFAPLLFGASGLAALGMAQTGRSLRRRTSRPRLASGLAAACVAAPLAWLVLSLPSGLSAADRSGDLTADDYASSALGGIATVDADIVVGLSHGVLVDYQVFPTRYHGWVLGYGSSNWWWFVPHEDDAAWRELVQRLAAEEPEAADWTAADLADRPAVLLEMASRRGRVYAATDDWIVDGGGRPEAIGWLSVPRATPPAAPADPARAEPWLDRARRWIALRPEDPAVHAMAVVPLVTLADELAARGEPEMAVEVLSLGQEVAPRNPVLTVAQARMLRRAGDPDSAAALLRDARSAARRLMEWHGLTVELGHALHDAGRWEESAAVFEDVIARRGAPGLSSQGLWSEERRALADCYTRLGRERDRRRVLAPLAEGD